MCHDYVLATISIFLESETITAKVSLALFFTPVECTLLSFSKTKKNRFLQVSEIEVFLSLESLHTKKSSGIDKVHPLLLKKRRTANILSFNIYF